MCNCSAFVIMFCPFNAILIRWKHFLPSVTAKRVLQYFSHAYYYHWPLAQASWTFCMSGLAPSTIHNFCLCKNNNSSVCLGTDSPKAVRKLMALSEPGKTRRHQPKHSVSSLHTNPSPTTSPKLLRKGHERSASETAAPVSLSAESSSVAALTTVRKGEATTSKLSC